MKHLSKRKLITLSLISFIILFCVLFTQFFSPKFKAYAENNIEVDQYTGSDNLINRTDKTIRDYSDQLFNTTSSISANGSIPFVLTIASDDPITEIIPKTYFKETGEMLYIGEEYGFYINTYAIGNYNYKSEVLIFDITTQTDLITTIDQVIIDVKVLFQYEYIYLDQNATMFTIANSAQEAVVQYSINNADGYVVPMPYLNIVGVQGYTYYFAYYSQVSKYYLKDISYAGRLYNEQEPNVHDSGYYAYNDIGSYFTSYDYTYNGLSKQRGEPIDPSDAVFLGLNDVAYVLGWIPGLNIVGSILATPGFIYDNISLGSDIYNACVPSLVETNSGEINATLYYQNRDDQILYHGNLTKTAALIVNSGDNSVWYDVGHNATGHFRINHSALNGQTPNYTRFIREIGLKIVDNNESKVRTSVGSHTYMLREKVHKEMTLGTMVNAYVMEDGVNYFKFMPEISGWYTFQATGNDNAQLLLNDVEDQTTDNQGRKITAYLEANQTYYLEGSLSNASTGRYFINVDVETFGAPQEKNVLVKPNGNLYRLFPTKNAAFAFTSTNSNLYFQLLDRNLNQVVSSSSSTLHHYIQTSESYFLRVLSKVFTLQSSALKIAEVSAISENSQLNVYSNNELRLYKFTAPSNIAAGTYYSIIFSGFSGILDPEIHGLSVSIDTMSTNGCYVMSFTLNANQEIYIGAKVSGYFYMKASRTDQTFKWVVGGIEQSGNNITLKAGSATSIKLRINGYYFDGYIRGFSSNYYSYSNSYFTIDPSCPTSDFQDRDPYVHLYAVKDDEAYTLNIFIAHKLTTYFYKYSDNTNYGFNWDTISSVSTDKIDIVYKITTPYGDTASKTISNQRVSTSYSIQHIVENEIGYTNYPDVEVLIERLVLMQGNHSTTIYNTASPSFQGLTDLQKKQSFTTPLMNINPYFGIGSGWGDDPYTITCERHLNNIRRAKSYSYYVGEAITASFKLMTSFNLTWDRSWTPIELPFSGTFDGNGYYIKYRTNIPTGALSTDANYYGFFRIIQYGTVKNLRIYNSYVDGGTSQHSGELVLAGGLAGYNDYGTITNITVQSTHVYSYRENSWAGALFGFSVGGSISDCTVDTNTAVYGQGNIIGGLIGLGLSTSINNCTSGATVAWYKYAEDWEYNCAGGIAGKMSGSSIRNSKFTGTVKYATTSETDSRTFKPCLGQIAGLSENGTSLSNNVCDGTVDKGKLKIVTWTTGALWWIQTHSHNQYQNVSSGQCGYQS